MELAQVFNLVRCACKYTVVLSAIQEELLGWLGKKEPGSKLPDLFAKFKETLNSTFAWCEKYLEDFTEKLDRLKLDSLSPSNWEEMKVNLDRLHSFVASIALPGGSTDPLVQGFRPFVQFLARFKGEKKSANLLMYALQISARLRDILHKTAARQLLPTLNDKLVRTQTELCESLGALLANKALDLAAKSKAQDAEKIEALQASFSLGSPNPSSSCLEIASSLHPSARKAFLQAYGGPIREALAKLAKKDPASEARATELAEAFYKHYLQLEGPIYDSQAIAAAG